MLSLKLFTPFLLLASVAIANPVLVRRATTCGSNSYTNAQINAALNAGYQYYSEGTEAGSSDYPHTYNNYEGFDFPVDGPYQEFPLLESGVYTGGKYSRCISIGL